MKHSIYQLFWINLLLTLIIANTPLHASSSNTNPYEPTKDAIQGHPVTDHQWSKNQAVQYRDLLRNKKQQILILPFQVRNHGIDKPGRMLMTRYLTAAIEKMTQTKMINPSLLEYALGENNRRFNEDTVFDLAQDLKTKVLVTSYVGHDNSGKMALTLKIQREKDTFISSQTPIEQYEWQNIPFSHDELPSEQFKLLIDEIVQKIISKPYQQSVIFEIDEENSRKAQILFDSPKELLEKDIDNLIDESRYLQLLALLHPETSERKQERLFERSLVALMNVSQSNSEAAVLKARAYFYLFRRPKAIALLKQKISPQEKALFSFMQGNLEQQRLHTKNITGKINKLIASIELSRLNYQYNQQLEKPALEKLKLLPEYWQYYVARAIVDSDLWFADQNLSIKFLLDKNFPVAGLDALSIFGAELSRQQLPDELEVTRATLKHINILYKENTKALLLKRYSHQLVPLDEIELLQALILSNVYKTASIIGKNQGRLDSGLAYLRSIESIFLGNIPLKSLEAKFLWRKFLKAEREEQTNLNTQQIEIRKKYFNFGGGQSKFGSQLFFGNTLISKTSKNAAEDWSELTEEGLRLSFTSDFPLRTYWFNKLPSIKFRWDADKLAEQFDYLQTEFKLAQLYYEKAPKEDKYNIIQAIKQRFKGHPNKLEFLSQLDAEDSGILDTQKLFENEIKNKSTNWSIYVKSGKEYIRQGNYKRAKKIFLSYPLFKEQNNINTVALSNRAYEAGNYFFWRGDMDGARALYQISADYKTGSNAGLASHVRLALLDNDFETATYYSLQRAERYNSDFAYRDYMTLLHLQGKHKQANLIFDRLIMEKRKAYITTSVFIGHRIQGFTETQSLDWIMQDKFKEVRFGNEYFRELYGKRALLIDRSPTLSQLEKFQQLQYIPVGYSAKHQLAQTEAYIKLKNNDLDSVRQQFASDDMRVTHKFYYLTNMMPYFAYAFSETNDEYYVKLPLAAQRIRNKNRYVEEVHRYSFEVFDKWLAHAFVESENGNYNDSIVYLEKAFADRPHTKNRTLYTWYQLVEACEWLYQRSGHQAYLTLLLDWSKKYQIIQPWFAWAYAIEAKYTKDPVAKKRALGVALYLDKYSQYIAHFSDTEKSEAETWFLLNNPFNKDKSMLDGA